MQPKISNHISLDTLRYGNLKYRVWKKKQLFTKEESIIGILTRSLSRLENISRRTSMESQYTFIGRYGRISTVRFLMGAKSIIKMGTPPIMTYQILNCSKTASTRDYMEAHYLMPNAISLGSELMRLDILLSNGTDQKRDEHGIENMQRKPLESGKSILAYVKNVGRLIHRQQAIKNFVLINAKPELEESLQLIKSLRPVNIVELSSLVTNTTIVNFAQISVGNLAIGQRYKNNQNVRFYISMEAA